MPPQQKKIDTVVKELFVIANQKIEEIKVLKYLLKNTTQESEKRLYKALIHSNKVVIEDLMRESGYMLPQSKISNDFLQSLTKGEMKEVANQLLEKIEIND